MSTADSEHAEASIRQRAKLALRKQMRAVRGALPASACGERSERIAQSVLALEEVAGAQTVLAFASIRNEVQTALLIDAMHAAEKTVAFPRVADGDLVLHRVSPGDPLREGAFGVPEPLETYAIVDPGAVDFALIPALAVDPRGFRIGYGGGYYDRLVPQLSKACTCAVAYDFQLIAEVPDLPFDRPVDLIVTDARVIRVA